MLSSHMKCVVMYGWCVVIIIVAHSLLDHSYLISIICVLQLVCEPGDCVTLV
jgi:hypothetical protein